MTPALLTWSAAADTGLHFQLLVAADGGLQVEGGRVVGADHVCELLLHPEGLPTELTDRDGFRHLKGRPALHLGADAEVEDHWLSGQLAVAATDRDGQLVAASGVQTALLVDQRYATDAPLGVRWDDDGRPTIAVWAPTARAVLLHRTAEPRPEPWVPPTALDGDAASAGWSAAGRASGQRSEGAGEDTKDAGEDSEDAGEDTNDADADTNDADDDTNDADDEPPTPMTRAPSGLWEITGTPRWRGTAYRFEVEVYDPGEDRIVRNVVTDPWSVGLSADSRWSLLLDLDDLEDPALAPRGWAKGTRKPPFAGQARMVAYELHVSDFSAADDSVPEELRGTYRTFSLPGSHGVRHLRRLAEAGVSHLHLLPINDIASIPERRSDRITPIVTPAADSAAGSPSLSPPAPDSPLPQAAQQAVADHDGYNWGYDPYHWLVPEGSYATDPDGPTRIREVRELVAAVNGIGLRMVVDVVFNHAHRAGRHPFSVLDRIVPGYYHRLDDLGRVTTSTCCPNTATEHRMMERLITDAVLTWARAYRVDGFRFDLLGHHPAAQARRLRAALDGLTLERDGVDGSAIVLYGEGWNFGEVAGDARFRQATQHGLAGSGIGTFDDRLRDAVRGGNHTGSRREQGFASGLWWEPNDDNPQATVEVEGGGGDGSDPAAEPHSSSSAGGGDGSDPAAEPHSSSPAARDNERTLALHLTERVMLGVAGNLAELPVPCTDGRVRLGTEIAYGGTGAGYARRPQDQVAYVSAHDNETLFDALAAKLPVATSMDDRVRMQVVALATSLLGQGTPFLHAGSELLRSKSLDRDSYRSGTVFNAIDWTAQTTRWGIGVPPVASNPQGRELLAHLLRAIPAPDPVHIAACRDRTLELLRIRASSPLFGLPSAAAVLSALRFRVTGRDAVPGVVVWSIQGSPGRADHDLLLAINATPAELRSSLGDEPHEVLTGRRPGGWKLHPVLARSVDPVNHRSAVEGGVLRVPGRTVAVFLRSATG